MTLPTSKEAKANKEAAYQILLDAMRGRDDAISKVHDLHDPRVSRAMNTYAKAMSVFREAEAAEGLA